MYSTDISILILFFVLNIFSGALFFSVIIFFLWDIFLYVLLYFSLRILYIFLVWIFNSYFTFFLIIIDIWCLVITTCIIIRPRTIVDSLGRMMFIIMYCTYDVMRRIVLYCCMFIGRRIWVTLYFLMTVI